MVAKFTRIEDIPAYWAKETPTAIALIQRDFFVTYENLVRSIDEANKLLLRAGVKPGHRVMLVTENCAAAVCFIFAASQLDAAFVIVNARLSAHEIDTISVHCEPQVELYFESGFGDAKRHAIRRSATEINFSLMQGVFVRPAFETTFVERTGYSTAAIIYTSGTTGLPKGVMLTHANILFVAEALVTYRHMTPSDRSYAVLPISHAIGLTSILLSTLAAGGSIALRERFSIDALIADLESMHITMFQSAQVMYSTLLTAISEGKGKINPPKLRYIYAGGAPLDPTLKSEVEKIFGLPLHNGYGMTECSPTICHSTFGEWRRDSSVGPCLPSVSIRIVNEEGNDVAPGKAGELWVKGPNVMKGYFRDPATTLAAFTTDGWLRTGDLARRDDDCNIHLVGRIKDIIIRSGFNVYPAEVEAALNTHPEIEQSVIVGRHTPLNDEVVAFIQLQPGSRLDVGSLRDYLRDKVSSYKRPSEIYFLHALPIMSNGKIDRALLKKIAAQNQLLTIQ